MSKPGCKCQRHSGTKLRAPSPGAPWLGGTSPKKNGLLCLRLECSAIPDARESTSRARLVLASLLPVLLLAASGQCLLVSASLDAGGGAPALVAGFAHASHALPELGRCEQSARRRVGTHFGLGGFLTPVTSLASRMLDAGRFERSSFDPDGPLGLAQGWQFHWRTALEPRAPSSVS